MENITRRISTLQFLPFFGINHETNKVEHGIGIHMLVLRLIYLHFFILSGQVPIKELFDTLTRWRSRALRTTREGAHDKCTRERGVNLKKFFQEQINHFSLQSGS